MQQMIEYLKTKDVQARLDKHRHSNQTKNIASPISGSINNQGEGFTSRMTKDSIVIVSNATVPPSADNSPIIVGIPSPVNNFNVMTDSEE